MHGEDRPNIKTQLIIGALKFAEFPDHISIDYGGKSIDNAAVLSTYLAIEESNQVFNRRIIRITTHTLSGWRFIR